MIYMKKLTCPVCGERSLDLTLTTKKVPYFGDVLILSTFCKNCKFKHNDVFPVEIKQPTCYELKVKNKEDLNVKVVRSSSGTIEIPELGVKIEPGPAAQGFITNVEGILLRVEEVLNAQRVLSKNEKTLRKVDELLGRISLARDGKFKFTIRIKDPFGNSALIGRGVKKKKLTQKEVKKLKR